MNFSPICTFEVQLIGGQADFLKFQAFVLQPIGGRAE